MSQIKAVKDCQYNNKDINLPRAKGYNRSQLRYELCLNPAPQGYSYYVKEESYPLKTMSLGEVNLVVRNRYCQCVLELEELFTYLDENLFLDPEGNRLCYYCIGCVGKYPPNKRYLQDLYLDNQLCMYVSQARRYHAASKTKLPFKDGRITVSDKGMVIYLFRVRTSTGFVHQQILLKDGRQREQDKLLQYNHGDCEYGVDNLTTFTKTYGEEISERLDKLGKWMVLGNAITPDVKELLYEEVLDSLSVAIRNSCKLANLQPVASQFTFAFSTPCYISDHSSELSFLVLYYPVLRLWRRFYIVDQFGKSLPPTESGVYIKDIANKCIYVVGGCRIRYEQALEGNSTRVIFVRTFKYRKECWRIDLSKVEERRGSGKTIKKTTSRRGRTTTEELPVIPTLYPNNIIATELRPFPEDLSLAAGVAFSGFLFVFGGSFVKDNQPEVIQNCAYRLNLSANKWERLKDMPRRRHNHAVFVRDNRIYIIGGTETSGFNVPTTRFVDIYDPAKNTYESAELKDNQLLITMPTQLFGERCVVSRLNADEYLLTNGTPSTSFVFNAKTMGYYIGGSQVKLPVMAKGWKNTDYTLPGPKLQQIFDMQAVHHNGLFYYLHNSLAEEQLRVVYGNRNKWYTSRELSPTPEAE